MSPTRPAILVLAAACFALGGCGKSAHTPPAAASPTAATAQVAKAPTVSRRAAAARARFIAKADAICRGVYNNLKSNSVRNNRLARRRHTGPNLVLLAAQDAAYQKGANAELERLMPPSSLGRDWKEIIAGAHTLAADTAKIGEDIRAKRDAVARAVISASGELRQRVLAVARRDGFKDCALAV